LKLLQVEEHFKQETKDYLTTIKRLQEENRKLSASLTAATERDRYKGESCTIFKFGEYRYINLRIGVGTGTALFNLLEAGEASV
jgi:hypothetical protein